MTLLCPEGSLRLLLRAQNLFFTLYVTALATSMSGMEIFSSALLLDSRHLLCSAPPARAAGAVGASAFAEAASPLVAIAALGILWGKASAKDKLYDWAGSGFLSSTPSPSTLCVILQRTIAG